MKHIHGITHFRKAPALAVEPEDVAKYISQALDLAAALIGVVGGWQQLVDGKNPATS